MHNTENKISDEEDFDEDAELSSRDEDKGGRREQKPPPAAQAQTRVLYGFSESPSDPEPPRQAISQNRAIPISPSDHLLKSLGLDRLAQRLQGAPVELRIIVNSVAIRLPVLGYDLQDTALLCLVTGEVWCELPRTDNVQILLEGKTISATFLGQWHRFDWLPFQIIAFAWKEAE